MLSSGRLHLYHPVPLATFADFVESTSQTVTLLCDGDHRTGVRLSWNARPRDIAVLGKNKFDADALHTVIGGYDLFTLDTTAVPRNDVDPRTPLRLVTPLGRVQRLPSQERGLEPSETGDFARLEVLYPSATQRLTDERLNRSFGKRRATWYSPAESSWCGRSACCAARS